MSVTRLSLTARLTRTSSSKGPDYWTLAVLTDDYKHLVELRFDDEEFSNLMSSRQAYSPPALLFPDHVAAAAAQA